MSRLIKIARPPFLIVSMTLFLLGSLWAVLLGAIFSPSRLLFVYLVILPAQLSVHFGNDYFDMASDRPGRSTTREWWSNRTYGIKRTCHVDCGGAHSFVHRDRNLFHANIFISLLDDSFHSFGQFGRLVLFSASCKAFSARFRGIMLYRASIHYRYRS